MPFSIPGQPPVDAKNRPFARVNGHARVPRPDGHAITRGRGITAAGPPGRPARRRGQRDLRQACFGDGSADPAPRAGTDRSGVEPGRVAHGRSSASSPTSEHGPSTTSAARSTCRSTSRPSRGADDRPHAKAIRRRCRRARRGHPAPRPGPADGQRPDDGAGRRAGARRRSIHDRAVRRSSPRRADPRRRSGSTA